MAAYDIRLEEEQVLRLADAVACWLIHVGALVTMPQPQARTHMADEIRRRVAHDIPLRRRLAEALLRGGAARNPRDVKHYF